MKQFEIKKTITPRDTQSVNRYLHDISKEELITAMQEAELTQRIKQWDQQALEKLVKANLKFVVSVAKEYRTSWVSLVDLINEGNLWLIKAAQKFDETKGFKFISYAVRRIRQSIIQSLAEDARVVKLPRDKISWIYKIEKTIAKFEQLHHRAPTEQEIADIMWVNVNNVKKILEVQAKASFLDKPIESGDSSAITLMDTIKSDEFDDPDANLNKESLRIEIAKILNTIDSREKIIIEYFFGLDPNFPQGLTLEEIANKLDITKERVRQIKERGIRKIRNTIRSKSLKKYLG